MSAGLFRVIEIQSDGTTRPIEPGHPTCEDAMVEMVDLYNRLDPNSLVEYTVEPAPDGGPWAYAIPTQQCRRSA